MADDEEVFEEEVVEATRRSLIENNAIEGESSRLCIIAADADEDDEELVDYGSMPKLPSTPYDPATEVMQKLKEEFVLNILNQHLEDSKLIPP